MSFEPTHHERMRHRDCGTWLVEFSGRMLVVCPRCRGRALVAPRPGVTALEYFSELLFQPRRLACAGCGVVADWRAAERDGGLAGAVPGGTEDPFFRRPLWLQTRVRDRFCGPTTKRMLLPLPTPWVRGCVSVVLLRRGRCSPGCRPGRRRQSIARRCWQAWQLSWLLLNGRPPRTVPMPPTNARPAASPWQPVLPRPSLLRSRAEGSALQMLVGLRARDVFGFGQPVRLAVRRAVDHVDGFVNWWRSRCVWVAAAWQVTRAEDGEAALGGRGDYGVIIGSSGAAGAQVITS